MKDNTRKRVNKTVFNYLSVVGLWKDYTLDNRNPIIYYLLNSVFMNKSNFLINNIYATVEAKLDNFNETLNIDIPNKFFHIMVKEFYHIYNNIDEILNNQNEEVREILINFVGSEAEFNDYVDAIIDQYKNSLYELVRYYNSNDINYNEIKINLLQDRLNEYVSIEEYEKAIILRDKIKEIKGK